MNNILLATAGNSDCRRAEDYALDYCQRHGVSLNIVHCIQSSLSHYGLVDSLATEGDRSDFIEYSQSKECLEAECRLTRVTGKARSRNIHYQLYIEWKSPLYSILRCIRHCQSALLVVGGKEKRHYPFSLVNCLKRKATCAVMQIKSQDKKAEQKE